MQLLPLQNPNSRPFLPGTSFRNRSSPNTSLKSPKKLSLKCRRSEFFEQQNFTRPSDSSFSPQSPAALPPRVYVGHSIYKGKAALTIEPKAPEFVPLDASIPLGGTYHSVIQTVSSGGPHFGWKSGAIKLAKEGFVLLQFAPAVGTRQYDWNRKQVFSLSVTEIGTIMSLGAKDSCEFFHDPFKGKSEEGKIRKILKAEPLPDGSGHFFNLSVQNRLLNVDESIYIPVTKAEFTVLISAFNFILPYLLGWHAFANSVKPEDPSRSNSANPRSGADFEWGR